jgi:hypothetical protein
MVDETLNPPAKPAIINVPELEARVSALETALAGTIGHLIAGARTLEAEEAPKAKSAAQHALDWFEGLRAKYFQPKPASEVTPK